MLTQAVLGRVKLKPMSKVTVCVGRHPEIIFSAIYTVSIRCLEIDFC